MTPIEVIGVPTSAASFAPGQEKAPQAIREAGLVRALEATGHPVIDRGDPPAWRWRPDLANRTAQNLRPVVEHLEGARSRIDAALEQGSFPLVLGGNCTVAIALVAAMVSTSERVGLVYLDRHCDLNVPKGAGTTGEGALDWMGVAHMLGIEGALPELSTLGPRFPLLRAADVFFLGIQADQLSPWEVAWTKRLAVRQVDAGALAADPEAAGRQVLDTWAMHYERVAVHFDVDVVDFIDLPLAEAYHLRNTGLTYAQALAVLRVLLADSRIAGLSVAEVNPDHGAEDGSTLRAFASGLASLFLDRA